MALRISTGLRNKLMGINTTKVTNGTFDSATTGWTGSVSTLASVAGGVSGNCLEVTNAGYAYNTAAIATKIGHLYRVSGYYKKGTGTSGYIYVGTAAGGSQYYTTGAITDAAWAQYTTYFVATTTTTYISLGAVGAGTQLYDSVEMASMAKSTQDIFKDCFIDVYTGTQPTSPDDLTAETLLCTFYSDGAALGLEFDDAVAGVLSKKSTEVWSGTCVATGTAGWYRLYTSTDTPAGATSTEERVDGAIATTGSQLNFADTSFINGVVQTISTFTLTMPAG